jgi:iron complex outermembrane recepter protein
MNGMKPLSRCLALAFGGSLVLASASVYAQEAAKQERIEVTGSNIKRTDTETSSQVQIINREDIQRSGKQSIAEVIQSISANNSGTIPTSFTNGFASGSAAISLRGLGVDSTLVLVNGRRMATYGLADDGQRTFVDLNSIPLEAVERVEVFKDGGSAIYGSDAIAGVVNIILRKDYQGYSAGISLGTTARSDGQNTRLFAAGGFGDLNKDSYNLNFTIEGNKEKAIKNKDRDSYLGTTDLRSIGYFDSRRGALAAGLGAFPDGTPAYSGSTPYGTVRDPSQQAALGFYNRINLTPCGDIDPITRVCRFDTIGYNYIQPETERLNFFGRGTFLISPAAQAYAELGYFNAKVIGSGTPSGMAATVFDPRSVTDPVTYRATVNQQIVLPAGHPDNPLGINRNLSYLATDIGPRAQTTKNGVLRLVGGVTGTVADWNYDTGVGYIESNLTQDRTGYIKYSAFQAALNSGAYRINNPSLVSAETYAAIAPKITNKSKSSITFIDGKVNRELMELGGGALGIAIGTEFRQEKTDSPAVPGTDTADILGLGYSQYKSSRNVFALYGEVVAPVAKMLELNGALRYDRYSDYGSSTTPKVGFKFTPLKEVAIRGTYAEAFRAPGPAESGQSSSAGFTNIAVISTGNPAVKPVTAKSFTLGLVLEPVKDTSVSIDYYQIKRDNEIVGADQALILPGVPVQGLAGSIVPGAQPGSTVIYGPPNGTTPNSPVAAVAGPYFNANSTKTSGLDVDFRQKFNLGEAGKLTAGLTFTRIFSKKRILADGTEFEYVGTQGPYVESSATGTPQNKFVFSLAWDRGPINTSLNINYVSGMKGIDHQGETIVDGGDGTYGTSTQEGAFFGIPDGAGGFTAPTTVCGSYYPNGFAAPSGCKIPAFVTADLFIKYTGFKNLDISASVLNLLDARAPWNPYTYGGTNYNPGFHQSGAVGRYFNVGVKYKF